MRKDKLKLEKFIEIMDKQEYPLFKADVRKDEFKTLDSFFIYENRGRMYKSEANRTHYLQEFTLSFITKSDKEIDVIGLAEELQRAGLMFVSSEIDIGQVADANNAITAVMTTINFVHQIEVGY